MLRVMEVVVPLALADSLKPSTIGPALYLASGERARSRVLEFALAIFVVQWAGGVVIALGLGGAMIVGAGLLWRHRSRLARRTSQTQILS
jgi:hypothetical protein